MVAVSLAVLSLLVVTGFDNSAVDALQIYFRTKLELKTSKQVVGSKQLFSFPL